MQKIGLRGGRPTANVERKAQPASAPYTIEKPLPKRASGFVSFRQTNHSSGNHRFTFQDCSRAAYSVFFPAALAFAHLALTSCASRLRPAALILRRAFLPGLAADFRPLTFAQRARAAAAILALPAALSFRRLRGAAAAAVPLNSRANFFCNVSILCLMLAARRN